MFMLWNGQKISGGVCTVLLLLPAFTLTHVPKLASPYHKSRSFSSGLCHHIVWQTGVYVRHNMTSDPRRRFYPFKAQSLLYFLPYLASKSSPFSHHSVSMCMYVCMCVCVLYGSQNKSWLFRCTTLTGFITEAQCAYCMVQANSYNIC